MKKALLMILCIVMVSTLACSALVGCAARDTAGDQSATIPNDDPKEEVKAITVAIKSISKHGNVVLDTTFADMNANNIEVGDIITVTVGTKVYSLPVGTAFTDVDSGSMVCRFDLEDNEVAVAVNMGSFATVAEIGEKQKIDQEPGYKWDVKIKQVTLALKEKKGYWAEYNARNLTRTNVREDYAALSDAAYANYRMVAATGLKTNLLYRSSTPVDPDIARDTYAMAEMAATGIKSVLNLADSSEAMHNYATFADSYYSRCQIINLEMNYDFGSQEFGEKVKESVLFIIDNDGPYLIHCKEGKDRTGILCAILEAFAGATLKEVEEDYMLTYYNFYNVKPADDTYAIILKNNIFKTLKDLFDVEDIATADLRESSTAYLLSIGLTQADLDALASKIGG
jgi:protein tyrosine/serine phosphatase